ncbi:hypothetical protein [uncultured Rhodoblastus sp.]|uniref:hypothetical protein n=1 Tax=uncultured Rhodoblastus sp. TaxID=543037 RepID=UPI0025FF3DF5|nr:hypothetical protein [uncultured Rhodoblastus sp.]
MKQRRLLFIGAELALAGVAVGAPLPPRRPPEFSAPTTAKVAPQPPASAPAATQPPEAPGGRLPVNVDIDTLAPFNLPAASRQQMRQCGEEWRALKMAGKSAGLVWRSFAQKCLAR